MTRKEELFQKYGQEIKDKDFRLEALSYNNGFVFYAIIYTGSSRDRVEVDKKTFKLSNSLPVQVENDLEILELLVNMFKFLITYNENGETKYMTYKQYIRYVNFLPKITESIYTQIVNFIKRKEGERNDR